MGGVNVSASDGEKATCVGGGRFVGEGKSVDDACCTNGTMSGRSDNKTARKRATHDRSERWERNAIADYQPALTITDYPIDWKFGLQRPIEDRIFEANMKTIAIALLATSLLAGCAGKPVREPTSVKLNDGTIHYFIKTNFKPCPQSRDWAIRTLKIRADEICKSGYILVDEQTPVILEPMEGGGAKRDLTWEIKCRNVP
jgi:hypothetical protein